MRGRRKVEKKVKNRGVKIQRRNFDNQGRKKEKKNLNWD